MDKFIEKARELYTKYRRMIAYLFFGACAMVVNMVCYWAAYELAGLGNTASTIIAWLAAVIFAFVTNKLLVFQSRRDSLSGGLHELVSFFACRVVTGVLDVAIMYVAVDRLGLNALLWKLVSNVVVTVLNYAASRFFIFKPREK